MTQREENSESNPQSENTGGPKRWWTHGGTVHGVGIPQIIQMQGQQRTQSASSSQSAQGASANNGPLPRHGTRIGMGGSPPPPIDSEPDDEARAASEPGSGLARLEPAYVPPLPPWFRVHDPVWTDEPSKDLVMLTAPGSPAAQQFRSMRYRLEQEPEAQVIAVVSPRGAEGKSVTAANLALALAEGGRVRVLLVDASLKAPSQHTLFGIEGTVGLTSVIAAHRRDPRTPIDLVGISNSLYVLPAGPRVASAHAALGSDAAARILGAMRNAFRYVIVDASAVFGSGEILAWHGMIDRYIMVARTGKTTTEDLGRAADKIHRDKVLGVSLVGADAKSVAT